MRKSKRIAILSLITLFSISIFAWTEYRSYSVDYFVSNNVEALTNDDDDGEVVYFNPNVTCAYTQNGRVYFVGYTNNYVDHQVIPGCSGTGICDTSYPIQEEKTKCGWKSWVKSILELSSIAIQICTLF